MTTDEQKLERKKYGREWYLKNREYALDKARIYREKNRERIQNYQRSDKVRAYQRDWRKSNKEKDRKRAISWTRANPDKVKGYQNKYKDANADKIRARGSAWKRSHRKQVSAQEQKRKSEDLNFSIKKRIRSRVWHSVNRQSGKKARVTMELLGCSIASFRIYIESKFEPGMTWNNIHLDHIVPCSLFDLTKPEHQKICFHFSNYQPLFAADNIRKKARVLHPIQIGLPLSNA